VTLQELINTVEVLLCMQHINLKFSRVGSQCKETSEENNNNNNIPKY